MGDRISIKNVLDIMCLFILLHKTECMLGNGSGVNFVSDTEFL